MLKRFCDKCRKQIREKDLFYLAKIELVDRVSGGNGDVEAGKELLTVDYCTDCFDEMLKKMTGDNNEVHP